MIERPSDARTAATARRLRERVPDVVARFLDRVRADGTVPEADRLGETGLRDHIPELIDSIARALEAKADDASAATRAAAARTGAVDRHARDRLDRRYSLVSLLTEIAHLRVAVLEVLLEEASVDAAVLPELTACSTRRSSRRRARRTSSSPRACA